MRPYALVREREFLMPDEVKRLASSARDAGRFGLRNSLLIRLAYHHGMRVQELIDLEWRDIDLDNQVLCLRHRRTTGRSHPIASGLLTDLEALRDTSAATPVLLSARRSRLSDRTVHFVVRQAGQLAGIGFSVHPYMLRHSCGRRLAERGVPAEAIQQYLGLNNLANTQRYLNDNNCDPGDLTELL